MSLCRYDLSKDCNNTDCLPCMLDKIRADIERERSFQRTIDEYDIATGLRKALEIIDKYKESEE